MIQIREMQVRDTDAVAEIERADIFTACGADRDF